MLSLALLAQVAVAGPFEPASEWLPGTLGGLPPPWEVAVSPSEDMVAVLDGAGRVTLADADDLEVRWQVPLAFSDRPAHGTLAFGPRGLAVAAGPRDGAVRVAILDPRDGRLQALGRTPEGARVLDLRWTADGDLLTRTREPDGDNPIDSLVERTWGPSPTERLLGTWFRHRRYTGSDTERVFVDVTARSLDRSGNLSMDVRYRVWDDPWDPSSARPLNDCPEWSEVVHVSADGRLAYTMGRIRCIYDLDDGEVVAWETRQVPFWSALSPDGQRVVERHGKGGRRYGVVRNTADGKVQLELDDMEGAVFTRDAGLVVWTSHRLSARNLANGSTRWSLPLDGEVVDLVVAPDAGSYALVERVSDVRVRVRVIGADGAVRAVVDDVQGVRGFSPGGRLLLLNARSDHLATVDLRAPRSSGPPTHRAIVTALRIDDRGEVVSGDDEGRVRLASGTGVSAWQVPGGVEDLAWAGDELVAISAQPGPTPEEPVVWRVSRWALDDAPRKPTIIAEDVLGALLLDGGEDVVVFTPEGAEVGPSGRGRSRELLEWGGRGLGPDPDLAVAMPGRPRVISVLDSGKADKAASWALNRKGPIGNYPVALGRPVAVAAGSKRVAVLDRQGGGRVFKLDGGGAVELAAPGGRGQPPCCVAMSDEVVVIGTGRGTLRVHDAATGDLLQTLDPHFGATVSAVAVSPGGGWIAVGSDGGELRTYRNPQIGSP